MRCTELTLMPHSVAMAPAVQCVVSHGCRFRRKAARHSDLIAATIPT
jgi:hypothetical protein